MSSTVPLEAFQFPLEVHAISGGQGSPVVLIHGLAASLHDWDALFPVLVETGYSAHALDLLGHGDSAKPQERAYQMAWLVDHFVGWIDALNLSEPAVLIGHSLGGYLALEYARRFTERTRGLILADPFYANSQLSAMLRFGYSHPRIGSFFIERMPAWVVRLAIDVMSVSSGHAKGGLHALPEPVRAQTALDYMRTAPAAYAIFRAELNLTPYLPSIKVPTLVLWGDRDRTLSPASFEALVRQLPQATGASSRTGHVPHQAQTDWFNEQVLNFLASLPRQDFPAKTASDTRSLRLP